MRRLWLILAALTLAGCVPAPAAGPASTGPQGGCKSYYTQAPAVISEAIFQAFGYLGQEAVDAAGRVACCESGWGPQASNPSGARGLFELTHNYDPTIAFYAAKVGLPPDAWWDPWVNAQVARDSYVANGGWARWVCQP